MEVGLIQRITALNLFPNDVYHSQHILNDKTLPAELILRQPFPAPSSGRQSCRMAFTSTSAAPDLVRDDKGEYFVLRQWPLPPVPVTCWRTTTR